MIRLINCIFIYINMIKYGFGSGKGVIKNCENNVINNRFVYGSLISLFNIFHHMRKYDEAFYWFIQMMDRKMVNQKLYKWIVRNMVINLIILQSDPSRGVSRAKELLTYDVPYIERNDLENSIDYYYRKMAYINES